MTAYPTVLANSATMFRRSVLHIRRYPSLIFFIAVIPVLLLLLFTYVFGATLGAGLGIPAGGRDAYLAYVVPGILLVTVAGVGQGTAISVAMDMTEGIVARFRTMAIGRTSVLTGHVGGSMVQGVLALGIVTARRVAHRLPPHHQPRRVARRGRRARPDGAGHHLALGGPGHGLGQRRDRQQSADVPAHPRRS